MFCFGLFIGTKYAGKCNQDKCCSDQKRTQYEKIWKRRTHEDIKNPGKQCILIFDPAQIDHSVDYSRLEKDQQNNDDCLDNTRITKKGKEK